MADQAVGVPPTVIGNAIPAPGAIVWLSLATVGMMLIVRRRRVVA